MKKLWENLSMIVFVIVVAIGAYTAMKGFMLGICWLVDKITDALYAYRKKKGYFPDDSEDNDWDKVEYGEKG